MRRILKKDIIFTQKNCEDLIKQLGQNLAITNKFPVIRCSWFLFSKILLDQIWREIVRKQPSRGVLRKRCSENMLQIYRTPMPKCDFNKVAKQLYWSHTSAWVFSCKLREPLDGCFWQFQILRNLRREFKACQPLNWPGLTLSWRGPLSYRNQSGLVYMITTSVMKELT